MRLQIRYNDEEDEFTKDLSLEMRIARYTKKYFYPVYVIAMLAPVYLVGGSIRDLLNAKEPKDMDFVVIGEENKEWVLEVLAKFGISYGFNRFGGFKIEYEGKKIDLWTSDDLFSSMQYNVDGLYYDIKTGRLLSLTFKDYIDNGLREVNSDNNIDVGREKKLSIFDEEFRKRMDDN